jgi:hypothetical protein
MGKVTSRTSHERNLADHITDTDHSRTKISEDGKVIADKQAATRNRPSKRKKGGTCPHKSLTSSDCGRRFPALLSGFWFPSGH